jgi:hypothetical protein
VPADHRLVVQHISVFAIYSTTVSRTSVQTSDISASGSEGPGTAFFSPIAGNQSAVDQPVLLYSDAGEAIVVGLFSDGVISELSITITGYLLDCTVGPCAPIAH